MHPRLHLSIEVALLFAMRDGFPGRAHFIAHAMREIRNRLPGALGPEVRFRGAGYEDRTATVHKRWVAEGLPEDGSLPLPEASAPSRQVPRVEMCLLSFWPRWAG